MVYSTVFVFVFVLTLLPAGSARPLQKQTMPTIANGNRTSYSSGGIVEVLPQDPTIGPPDIPEGDESRNTPSSCSPVVSIFSGDEETATPLMNTASVTSASVIDTVYTSGSGPATSTTSTTTGFASDVEVEIE